MPFARPSDFDSASVLCASAMGKNMHACFFPIALDFHYLFIRQEASRQWKKHARLFFPIALDFHYLSIRQEASRQWKKHARLFFSHCARLSLSFHKTGGASAMGKNMHACFFPLRSTFTIFALVKFIFHDIYDLG